MVYDGDCIIGCKSLISRLAFCWKRGLWVGSWVEVNYKIIDIDIDGQQRVKTIQ